MKFKFIFYSLFLFAILACSKTDSKKELTLKKDTTFINVSKTKYSIAKLSPKSKDIVKDWKEYQSFDELIHQYQNISTNDALLNAKDLSVLAQQLKDSIRIEKLSIPSVKIRLNVLHNESLRLDDMSTINHINEQEVNQETENIINAYSALNLKLNNIINQENLNNEVIIDFSHTALVIHSTKIDHSIDKKEKNKVNE